MTHDVASEFTVNGNDINDELTNSEMRPPFAREEHHFIVIITLRFVACHVRIMSFDPD